MSIRLGADLLANASNAGGTTSVNDHGYIPVSNGEGLQDTFIRYDERSPVLQSATANIVGTNVSGTSVSINIPNGFSAIDAATRTDLIKIEYDTSSHRAYYLDITELDDTNGFVEGSDEVHVQSPVTTILASSNPDIVIALPNRVMSTLVEVDEISTGSRIPIDNANFIVDATQVTIVGSYLDTLATGADLRFEAQYQRTNGDANLTIGSTNGTTNTPVFPQWQRFLDAVYTELGEVSPNRIFSDLIVTSAEQVYFPSFEFVVNEESNLTLAQEITNASASGDLSELVEANHESIVALQAELKADEEAGVFDTNPTATFTLPAISDIIPDAFYGDPGETNYEILITPTPTATTIDADAFEIRTNDNQRPNTATPPVGDFTILARSEGNAFSTTWTINGEFTFEAAGGEDLSEDWNLELFFAVIGKDANKNNNGINVNHVFHVPVPRLDTDGAVINYGENRIDFDGEFIVQDGRTQPAVRVIPDVSNPGRVNFSLQIEDTRTNPTNNAGVALRYFDRPRNPQFRPATYPQGNLSGAFLDTDPSFAAGTLFAETIVEGGAQVPPSTNDTVNTQILTNDGADGWRVTDRITPSGLAVYIDSSVISRYQIGPGGIAVVDNDEQFYNVSDDIQGVDTDGTGRSGVDPDIAFNTLATWRPVGDGGTGSPTSAPDYFTSSTAPPIGDPGQILQVNTGGAGLEFINQPFTATEEDDGNTLVTINAEIAATLLGNDRLLGPTESSAANDLELLFNDPDTAVGAVPIVYSDASGGSISISNAPTDQTELENVQLGDIVTSASTTDELGLWRGTVGLINSDADGVDLRIDLNSDAFGNALFGNTANPIQLTGGGISEVNFVSATTLRVTGVVADFNRPNDEVLLIAGKRIAYGTPTQVTAGVVNLPQIPSTGAYAAFASQWPVGTPVLRSATDIYIGRPRFGVVTAGSSSVPIADRGASFTSIDPTMDLVYRLNSTGTTEGRTGIAGAVTVGATNGTLNLDVGGLNELVLGNAQLFATFPDNERVIADTQFNNWGVITSGSYGNLLQTTPGAENRIVHAPITPTVAMKMGLFFGIEGNEVNVDLTIDGTASTTTTRQRYTSDGDAWYWFSGIRIDNGALVTTGGDVGLWSNFPNPLATEAVTFNLIG